MLELLVLISYQQRQMEGWRRNKGEDGWIQTEEVIHQ